MGYNIFIFQLLSHTSNTVMHSVLRTIAVSALLYLQIKHIYTPQFLCFAFSSISWNWWWIYEV